MFIKSAIEEYNQPVLWQLQEIQRVMIETEDDEDWPGTAGMGQ